MPTALAVYSTVPAPLVGIADRLGKIAPGYLADLVLLDHDPTMGAKSLADDPVTHVWVAGDVTTHAPDGG